MVVRTWSVQLDRVVVLVTRYVFLSYSFMSTLIQLVVVRTWSVQLDRVVVLVTTFCRYVFLSYSFMNTLIQPVVIRKPHDKLPNQSYPMFIILFKVNSHYDQWYRLLHMMMAEKDINRYPH